MKIQAKDMTNNRIKDFELGRDNRFQNSMEVLPANGIQHLNITTRLF